MMHRAYWYQVHACMPHTKQQGNVLFAAHGDDGIRADATRTSRNATTDHKCTTACWAGEQPVLT
jgi:hypothetical protein